jgi:hypothetical protein
VPRAFAKQTLSGVSLAPEERQRAPATTADARHRIRDDDPNHKDQPGGASGSLEGATSEDQTASALSASAGSRLAVHVTSEILGSWDVRASDAHRRAARARVNGVQLELVQTPAMIRAGAAPVEIVKLPPGASVAAALASIREVPGVERAKLNFLYEHIAASNDPYFTGAPG